MTRVISEAFFYPMGVSSRPWVPGDKLMLRISQSEPDLTGATNDPSCPSPGP